jgi:hypothetical protein
MEEFLVLRFSVRNLKSDQTLEFVLDAMEVEC